MKNKLAVIGTGSAGIQALSDFLAWTDKTWEITSISDPTAPIFKIAESTAPGLVDSLEYGCHFSVLEDIEKLKGTVKLGSVWKNWNEKSFVSPFLKGGVAIHADTEELKKFALTRFKEIWEEKFQIRHGCVKKLHNLADRVVVECTEENLEFDYVIDCRGTLKSFDDYIVLDGWPVNRCLIHNIKKSSTQMYTGINATPDGWMFEIPLEDYTSYGYNFNDSYTDLEQAKKNFSDILNVPVKKLELRDIKYSSYYSENAIQGRIVKNGNRAFFIEPMHANSLVISRRINFFFNEFLKGKETPCSANSKLVEEIKQLVEFIGFHYHCGSIYDTDFWRYAKEKGIKIILEGTRFYQVVPLMRKMIKDKTWATLSPQEVEEMRWHFGPFQFLKIAQGLQFDYFD